MNKLETKVQLRLFVTKTRALTESQKMRLRAAYPGYLTANGDLVLTCEETRSQEQNKSRVFERLSAFLCTIERPPRRRVATRPTRGSKERRLEDKRRRATLKTERRGPV